VGLTNREYVTSMFLEMNRQPWDRRSRARCPMCASAIRWAGFKEVIYGSSIRTIAESECGVLSRLRRTILLGPRGVSYLIE
jgi:hypothetical protein